MTISTSVWSVQHPNAGRNIQQLWLPELFLKAFFSLQNQFICDFLAGNNFPDSPHSQGGMKFATQISPLLNLVYLRVCFDFLGKIGKGVGCKSVENFKQKYF